MDVPNYLARYPSRAAIAAIARRFGLPNEPGMQDWEYQVADPSRLTEFLSAYEGAGLTDDERFVLMAMMVQSCEDLPSRESDERWTRVLQLLDRDVALHISTIWYWAAPDARAEPNAFGVGQEMRRVLDKHRNRFERPS